MPRYITLKLVNEQGTPLPWPGVDTDFELGTAASVTPVWIGVSQDGTDNQIFPLTASPATILASWPRLYQGIQINTLIPGDDSPGEVEAGEYVYYASLTEYERLVAACCVARGATESPCAVTVNYDLQTSSSDTVIISQGGTELLHLSGTATGTLQAQAGVPLTFTVATASGLVETNTVVSTDPTFSDPEQELCNDSPGIGNTAECEVTLECGTEYYLLGTAFPTP